MAVSYTDGAIVLDNPPANSYDIDFMRELGDAVDAASSDGGARVVVVRSGSERFFSAGADVKKFLASDVEANMEMIRTAHDALGRMARSEKMFVALIAGHALGGGLEIALACDLRYALEGSYRLGTPEVTLGLLPGNGGTQRLTRLIGLGPALDVLVTGRQLSPEEAQRLGLVSAVFTGEDEFRAQVEKLAALPPLAIANIKRAAYEGSQMSLEDGLALERELIEELFRSRDAREGLEAFTEKRAPAFTGA
ncbi:MAG TPA: enoyl-CoA hydratase/isomerase family protein [Thermoleophilaceae bacterium]|nr:enoyl-CoA hydratase/isomerase family protein [Thermoleophilaceae bacterium]